MTLHRIITLLQELNLLAELLLKLWIVFSFWFVFLLFMYFKAVRFLAEYVLRFLANLDPAAVGERVTPSFSQVYIPSPTHQPNSPRDSTILRDTFGTKWRNERERQDMTALFSDKTIPKPGFEEYEKYDYYPRRTVLSQKFGPPATDIPQHVYDAATLLKSPEYLPSSYPQSGNVDKPPSYLSNQQQNHNNFVPTPPGYQIPPMPPGYQPPTTPPEYQPPTTPPEYQPPTTPPGYQPPPMPPGYQFSATPPGRVNVTRPTSPPPSPPVQPISWTSSLCKYFLMLIKRR